jgi:serine/threonine protein kinase
MAKKLSVVCLSCGQKIAADEVKEGEAIFCETCMPDQTIGETVALDAETVAKTQSFISDQTMDAEETIDMGQPDAGVRTGVKLEKSIAATKVIKDILKVEPRVDLEHTSKIYFALRGEQPASKPEASIRDIISGTNQDTKYILHEEIGRGGMGAVLGTVDQDVRRKVAMKIMLPSDKPNIPMVRRFLEEAQITGQLEHPNIVPVHEIGIDEDLKIYFTMKLVKGENLEQVIAKIANGDEAYQEIYSLGNLIQLFMKVCDGISFAHSRGVLHRDLKPENIMVGDFGEVLVMDWGIAKVLGQQDIVSDDSSDRLDEQADHIQTLEGRIMGTPSFMPPEQAWGNISELDERSDVFALGGILYKILTHQSPYKGKSATEILGRARNFELVPPDLRAPQHFIPPELNAICMKAMSPDKEDRYANALALKNDLQLYLDGKSVSAKRDSFVVRTKKWIVRNKVAAMGIAAAVVCLVIGVIATGLYHREQTRETIANLLTQGESAVKEGKYEAAEETFFSVLGLDNDNAQARKGIARVSGKALALKNKRLAKETIKEAKSLFDSKDYVKAYDAYVATLALDSESKEAIQGIKIAAVQAEKQKAQEKIEPILNETKVLDGRKRVVDKKVAQLKAKMEQLKSNIKGYEGFEAKKPYWDAEKALLSTKIDNLKLESEIISKYLTVLSHDGENTAARKALAQIYYNKYVDGEAVQNKKEMAYYRALILTFDDGYYQRLLQQNGSLTLVSTPIADHYYLYRFLEGPDRRMIPAPFSPTAFFSGGEKSGKDGALPGIDPEFKLSKAAFSPIRKLLTSTNFNLLKQINTLKLPSGSYLVILKKNGYIDTRVPVLIKRGEDTVIQDIKILKKKEIPPGFVYVPKGSGCAIFRGQNNPVCS